MSRSLRRGARAAGTGEGQASFLARAFRPADLLGDATVEISWSNDSAVTEKLASSEAWLEPGQQGDVCYLSQQFVDRLCSSTGLAGELRDEIERVIFEATDQELQAKLPQLSKDRDDLIKRLGEAKRMLAGLLPKGSEERAKRLVNLEEAHAAVQSRIEVLKRRLRALEDLAREIDQIRKVTEVGRLSDMRARHSAAELIDESWRAFAMVFAGDVDKILADARTAVETATAVAADGDPESPIEEAVTPLASWPLNLLRERVTTAKTAVGMDAERQRKYNHLRKSIEQMENSLRRVNAEIESASGAAERRRALIEARFTAYAEVFAAFTEEETALTQLYEPLSLQLNGAQGALGLLELFVHRRVDLDSWVELGERDLLDLRLESRLRGHGALKKEAEERLLPALSSGAAEDVAKSMDVFRREFADDLTASMPRKVAQEERGKWIQSVAEWLYSTDHVRVEYGIRYDGTAIEQLSPGTRGIVLLLLYLAIDVHDPRPIIVDQPEENLDPKSVFDELVPHFREARHRRQVIIVTHNANLVVNTDADQVIVASSVPTTQGGLPRLSYDAGSLENPRIRKAVCETLEGGERAFLDRERRYRLRWLESLAADERLPAESGS